MIDYIFSRFNTFTLGTNGKNSENISREIIADFHHVSGSKTLLVVIPGWNQKLSSGVLLNKHAKKLGLSILTYQFPGEILSDNKDFTKDCFEIINTRVRNDIKKYKAQYGFQKCHMLALSLGTSIGSVIYKNNEDINELTLVVPGENLARDMWFGWRTQHLRKSYERQGISLEDLEKDWSSLASENNMPCPGTIVNIHYGKTDRIIPYRFSKTLATTLEKNAAKVSIHNHLLGHYMTYTSAMIFPSKFIEG